VKQKKCLFVFFQGHPEYDQRALLREFRRDIGRFLRRERETYPEIPHGYFRDKAMGVLAAFRELALSGRREDMLDSFPSSVMESSIEAYVRVVDRPRLWQLAVSPGRTHGAKADVQILRSVAATAPQHGIASGPGIGLKSCGAAPVFRRGET